MSDPEEQKRMDALKTLPAKYQGLELSPAKGVRQSAPDLYLRAQIILQSGMAPPSFKNVKELVYALGMGQDLGFTNLQSLANIAVINNRPSVYADGLPTILLRSGHFFMEDFSGSIEDGTYKASITIERKDSGSVITREFDVDDAKRAGLWQTEARITKRGRNGSYECDNDSPWWKYPKRMIWRRAIGWAVRDALADEMYGLQIVEEMNDHLVTINASAEPKTSKLSDKLKNMGPDDDDKPEIIDIDVEEDEDLPPEVNDEFDQSEPEEIEDAVFSEEDETPAERIEAKPGHCEEASLHAPAGMYLPCNKPAVAVVEFPSKELCRVCEACLDHATKNRGATKTEDLEPEPAEKVFDSNGRNLPGLALDWFDYLNSPVFDVSSFDKDFAEEQDTKWYKELSEEDRQYIDDETNKIVAKQKEGSK